MGFNSLFEDVNEFEVVMVSKGDVLCATGVSQL